MSVLVYSIQIAWSAGSLLGWKEKPDPIKERNGMDTKHKETEELQVQNACQLLDCKKYTSISSSVLVARRKREFR